MFFSVCMPVYNTSEYLKDSLESVLKQTEKDYEIILIDDGSTDESGTICDNYAEEYPFIRTIHKKNEGLLMTRRRGFQEATGDYIICLDSDDMLLDSDMFLKIKKFILKNNCDLVLFNYVSGKFPDSDDKKIVQIWDKPDAYLHRTTKTELYRNLLLGKNFNSLWTKVIARSLIDTDTDYSAWNNQMYRSQGEDALQSLPVLDSAKCIGYMNEPFYFYRVNNQSISNNVNWNYFYDYKMLYQRQDEYIKKWNIDAPTVKRIHRNRVITIMSLLINGIYSSDRKVWLAGLRKISADSYFRTLLSETDHVLPYYRIVYFEICHGLFSVMIPTIRFIHGISSIKKKLIRRNYIWFHA